MTRVRGDAAPIPSLPVPWLEEQQHGPTSVWASQGGVAVGGSEHRHWRILL